MPSLVPVNRLGNKIGHPYPKRKILRLDRYLPQNENIFSTCIPGGEHQSRFLRRNLRPERYRSFWQRVDMGHDMVFIWVVKYHWWKLGRLLVINLNDSIFISNDVCYYISKSKGFLITTKTINKVITTRNSWDSYS